MIVFTPLYYTGNHRLEYFQQYINSATNSIISNNVNFLFIAEPGSEPMISMIPKTINHVVIRNSTRRGLLGNVFYGLNYAFDVLNESHVIYLEEDVIFSKDIFLLSQFYINNIDPLSILCFLNKHKMFYPSDGVYNVDDPSMLISIKNSTYYAPWGTCISKVFWQTVWLKLINIYKNDAFDYIIDQYVKDVNIFTPQISRLNTIGKIGSGYNEELYKQHGFDNVKLFECDPELVINYKIKSVV